MDQYSVCIVGCGRMGGTIDEEVRGTPHGALPYSHAAGYTACERTTIVAAADIVEEKAKYVCSKWDIPKLYTDYREMIEKEKPDIVSVATRPGDHAEITIFAAEHGVKGVYCDKPLCASMEEADAMYDACEQYGVKFNLGTQRRFSPGYIKMREIMESGEIGERRSVIAYSGGGALWTYTHAADMLLFLASDSDVEYVQGNVAVDDADFEDNRTESDPGIVMGYVRFKNGTHGISLLGSAYEFEVDCSGGTVRSLNNGQSFQLRKQQGEFNQILDVEFPSFERKSGTVGCIEDIVTSMDTDQETRGNIRLARISTEITFGIVDSQRQKGSRVYMPMENRSLYLGRW
ncbi:Gfo/Idh/MocA family protein [Candidatus Poribacteria bacterium]